MEAQIANISDELAYNAHDLDDGLRASLLRHEQLDGLDIWQMVKESVGWDGKTFDDRTRHQLIRRLISLEIQDAIEGTNRRLVETGVQSVEALQRLPQNVIGNSDHFAAMNEQLKTFLYDKLYRHYRVVRMSIKAQRYLEALFETYIADPAQLPFEVQGRIEHKGLHRAVADYIAGMTDRFALQEWERLYDPFTRP